MVHTKEEKINKMFDSNKEVKKFEHINALGTISFGEELITNIIKIVLKDHSKCVYNSYSIKKMFDNYYEISIILSVPSHDINFKEIDAIKNDLLLIFRQSLRISCVVFINIK